MWAVRGNLRLVLLLLLLHAVAVVVVDMVVVAVAQIAVVVTVMAVAIRHALIVQEVVEDVTAYVDHVHIIVKSAHRGLVHVATVSIHAQVLTV